MINLRDYQLEAIDTIYETFKTDFFQFIELPTGSGKTITFLSYAKRYHIRTLVIVPSRELLKQVAETALLFYEPWEISRKGDRYDEEPGKIHICTIQSIRGHYLNYLAGNRFDITVIDEAHHSQASSYKRFIKLRSKIFHERDMKILGVTATPDRTDGQLLKEILGKCSFKLSIEELIKRGHLSDVEGFSVKTNIDLSYVHDHNRDFSLNQLYKKLCVESRNNMILELVKDEMEGRKTIIFCINIAHSKQISSLLNSYGIASHHIDGKMGCEQRSTILSAFKAGEISALCNCQLLTEGFDEPSIDGVILARPTRSRSLFMQMIGRGLRLSPGKKNCKILDIVDNHKNLAGFNGLIDDVIYPSPASFKNISDIRKHIGEEMLKVTEFSINRVDLFNSYQYDDLCAISSQTDYLDSNNIQYYQPLSFDEASFLIWHDKLKKEFYGNNRH